MKIKILVNKKLRKLHAQQYRTHHIALEPDKVHLHLKRLTPSGVVCLDVVQQVGEELVASLQDAQGNQRVLEVVADVLGEARRPTGEKVWYHK